MTAFKQVNGHFEELFTRLFGGGRAHLSLTEADDQSSEADDRRPVLTVIR